jgi:mycothiol synthase
MTARTAINRLPCYIRNYLPDDFESYVRFHDEARKLDSVPSRTLALTIAMQLHRPHYDPTQDLFLAIADGKVIAYLDVSRETEIGRVILDCMVCPDERRKGIATALFDHATHYAAETGIQIVHINIARDNIAAKGLLQGLGFTFVRHFIEFGLNFADTPLPHIPETEFSCRHLQHGEEQVLAELQNRVFINTWGFNPNTVEDIVYSLKLQAGNPSNIIVAVKENQIIGYCWTVLQGEKGIPSIGQSSLIHMLGVDPEYRWQGTGKMLLSTGLRYLKEKGTGSVTLTADSENTDACNLYRSLGFRIISTLLWYERRLA